MRGILRTAQNIYESLSHSGRMLFFFFAALCVASTLGLVYLLNASLLVPTPSYGGSLSEGIIGAPRFINPVLAVSDSDHDLTALIYSGLLKATPQGDYVPDLAQSYTISPDGKTYTFYLRPDATFHDGAPVTADDVVFTIQKTQDPALKSPLQADWDGVAVTELDAHTVEFTLQSPYAPFIENMTLGILPKHLWENVSDDEFSFSELNTSPVGSGPFKLQSISRNDSGIPSAYSLVSFSQYASGQPYLDSVTLKFYQSESDLAAALKSGAIQSASGVSPASLADLKNFNIETSPLNRVFGVFFNQNQSVVLRDHDVRQALEDAINRQQLVSAVLGGYGTPITGPVPPSVFATPQASSTDSTSSPQATSTDLALAAQQELLKDGWSLGADGVLTKTTGKGKNSSTETLTFDLATDNVPELVAASKYLSGAWDRMGAQVNVQIYDQGDLSAARRWQVAAGRGVHERGWAFWCAFFRRAASTWV